MLATCYCNKCKGKLKSFGGLAFQLFDRIFIEYIVEQKPIELETLDHANFGIEPIIRYLENKNFIITTESGKDRIQIKPKGIVCSETLKYTICHVCFDRNNHRGDFDNYEEV